jgi:hypothetical protein
MGEIYTRQPEGKLNGGCGNQRFHDIRYLRQTTPRNKFLQIHEFSYSLFKKSLLPGWKFAVVGEINPEDLFMFFSERLDQQVFIDILPEKIIDQIIKNPDEVGKKGYD